MMVTRRTKNTEVAHLNPWIMRCLGFSRRERFGSIGNDIRSSSDLQQENHGIVRVTGSTGSQTDGIVLATFGPVIRVAIPGCDDAAEFLCRGGRWFSEDGELVEIDFAASGDADDGLNDRAADADRPERPGSIN